MLKPEYTTRFKKDLKIIEKRKLDIELLKDIIRKLCKEEPLPVKTETTIYQEIGQDLENVIFCLTGFWFIKLVTE